MSFLRVNSSLLEAMKAAEADDEAEILFESTDNSRCFPQACKLVEIGEAKLGLASYATASDGGGSVPRAAVVERSPTQRADSNLSLEAMQLQMAVTWTWAMRRPWRCCQ